MVIREKSLPGEVEEHVKGPEVIVRLVRCGSKAPSIVGL